jgi:hypothetical protein
MQIENLSGIAGCAGRCHACAQQYNRKRKHLEYLKARLFLFKEKQSRAKQIKSNQSKTNQRKGQIYGFKESESWQEVL